MHDRHADYYVCLVEAAAPKLLLPDQVIWYKLFQAEHDNIRAVIEWSAESDQAESALRLVGALWWFWWAQSSSSEGCDLALKALASPSAFRSKDYRARALNTAGCLQWVLGDIVSARQSLEEALSILRTSDDKASLAYSLQFMGLVFTFEGEFDLADAAFREGMAVTKGLTGVNASSFSFFAGDVDLLKGDISRAKKVYQESSDILLAIGNKIYAAYPLRRLGYLALEQNDFSKAQDYFRESLRINREVGDERAVCASLVSLAALAVQMDKPVVAARIHGVVEKQLESLSINMLYLDQIELWQIRLKLADALDEATFQTAFSEGWEMSEEQAIALAEQVYGGGDL